MGVLDAVREPQDLRRLSDRQLEDLAAEIRSLLVSTVARTGGHLGPNLGVVELTIAIHRVFDSPHDPILFDTGHQAYVHKLLTGRAANFETLRQEGGLSGYPNRAESIHDWVENSHASTALSYADGLSKAFQVTGQQPRTVVAVVGDGALTGGMAWEALNNIAADARNVPSRSVVIVINDNGRSYTPTVGGVAEWLNALRTNPRYEQSLDLVKTALGRTRIVGPPLYDALHGLKRGIKDVLAPQGLFEDLGLKYIGPIDGHDRSALEHALQHAKRFRAPVIVHAVTRKGMGYEAAERHQADQMHSPRPFDPRTGLATGSAPPDWTSVFRTELVAIAAERADVVAVTAAMMHPTGLDGFKAAYPDRCFDVGIAEQHAATSAAGMAMAGLHPVVAIYSTFLNRAFDQVLMDVALHRCGVTFVLDRAGFTGDDGASHNGVWDMSILQVVPGLRLAAPRDATRLRELLREAIDISDAPTVVRFPKGSVGVDIDAVDRLGGCDVLHQGAESDVALISVGALAGTAVETAQRLAAQGIGVTVIDPRWVKPVDPALVALAKSHRLVVTIEDSGRVGGVGAAVAQLLRDEHVGTPLRDFGVPQAFYHHAKRDSLLSSVGLTAQSLAREIAGEVARLDETRSRSVTTAGWAELDHDSP